MPVSKKAIWWPPASLARWSAVLLIAVLFLLINLLVDDPARAVQWASLLGSSLLAPLAASLIQMAISRAREFEADRGGAEISGDANALADALTKIDAYARGIPMPTAEAHPATAQMMIVNPLSGGGISGLFSTHPATEERVARMRQLAAGQG